MDHERSDSCPMCGSLMGAEAHPAAMRTQAERLDRIDQLERLLREAERGSWTVTAALVCTPCQRVLVAAGSGPDPDVAQGLRDRLQELRRESAEGERRSA